MSDICKCFAPVENAGCTILILGSMPGERSLELQQYYGHKNNRFWRLMAEIFNNGKMLDDYEERKALLLRSNIALWDVLAFCRRPNRAQTKASFQKFITPRGRWPAVCASA